MDQPEIKQELAAVQLKHAAFAVLPPPLLRLLLNTLEFGELGVLLFVSSGMRAAVQTHAASQPAVRLSAPRVSSTSRYAKCALYLLGRCCRRLQSLEVDPRYQWHERLRKLLPAVLRRNAATLHRVRAPDRCQVPGLMAALASCSSLTSFHESGQADYPKDDYLHVHQYSDAVLEAVRANPGITELSMGRHRLNDVPGSKADSENWLTADAFKEILALGACVRSPCKHGLLLDPACVLDAANSNQAAHLLVALRCLQGCRCVRSRCCLRTICCRLRTAPSSRRCSWSCTTS